MKNTNKIETKFKTFRSYCDQLKTEKDSLQITIEQLDEKLKNQRNTYKNEVYEMERKIQEL